MNRLRVVRAEKRVSQFQLRLETGINTQRISYIENDLIEANKEEREKISKALGVEVCEIFGDQASLSATAKN